jgi:hypothetical protein
MSPWRPQGGPAARPSSRRPAVHLQLLSLEERAVPSTVTGTDPTTDPTTTPVTTPTTDPTTTPTVPAVRQVYAVGAGLGNQPLVQVYNPDGTVKYSFLAYDPDFRGGVRVAMGDVTGDGVPDIVTAPGAGLAGQIKVFDGTSGAQVASFMAYNEAFKGGVYVAVGDVNGDGHADIITGAGAGGGPHVKVFDGQWAVPPVSGPPATTPPVDPTVPQNPPGVLEQYFAYGVGFRGGVDVAAADMNADGKADVITGAGPGGGPHVKVFSGTTGQELFGFFAFGPNYAGGVYVTAGDMVGDGKAELAVGSGVGLQQVNIYNGAGTQLRSYTVGDQAAVVEGVPLAMADVDGDGKADLLIADGTDIQVRNPLTNATIETVTPFDPTVLGGVFVG